MQAEALAKRAFVAPKAQLQLSDVGNWSVEDETKLAHQHMGLYPISGDAIDSHLWPSLPESFRIRLS